MPTHALYVFCNAATRFASSARAFVFNTMGNSKSIPESLVTLSLSLSLSLGFCRISYFFSILFAFELYHKSHLKKRIKNLRFGDVFYTLCHV